MTMRLIEVFVAGCPLCEEAVQQVKSISCPSCDVQVLDMRTDKSVLEKATRYGVKRVPAIVIDGKLAECCSHGAIDVNTLKSLGVGKPQ